jgi:hypothetical protein
MPSVLQEETINPAEIGNQVKFFSNGWMIHTDVTEWRYKLDR